MKGVTQGALTMGSAWLTAVFYNSHSSSFSFSTFSKYFKKVFIIYAPKKWYKNVSLRLRLIML